MASPTTIEPGIHGKVAEDGCMGIFESQYAVAINEDGTIVGIISCNGNIYTWCSCSI